MTCTEDTAIYYNTRYAWCAQTVTAGGTEHTAALSDGFE